MIQDLTRHDPANQPHIASTARGAAAGTANAAKAEKTISVRFMAFSIPDAPLMGIVWGDGRARRMNPV